MHNPFPEKQVVLRPPVDLFVPKKYLPLLRILVVAIETIVLEQPLNFLWDRL
jgi:hypothetical protein